MSDYQKWFSAALAAAVSADATSSITPTFGSSSSKKKTDGHKEKTSTKPKQGGSN